MHHPVQSNTTAGSMGGRKVDGPSFFSCRNGFGYARVALEFATLFKLGLDFPEKPYRVEPDGLGQT